MHFYAQASTELIPAFRTVLSICDFTASRANCGVSQDEKYCYVCDQDEPKPNAHLQTG